MTEYDRQRKRHHKHFTHMTPVQGPKEKMLFEVRARKIHHRRAPPDFLHAILAPPSFVPGPGAFCRPQKNIF